MNAALLLAALIAAPGDAAESWQQPTQPGVQQPALPRVQPVPPRGIRVAGIALRGDPARVPAFLAAVARIYPPAKYRTLPGGNRVLTPVEVWGSRAYMNNLVLARVAQAHGLQIVQLVRYRAR